MRVQPIDREHAGGKAGELLDQLAVGGSEPGREAWRTHSGAARQLGLTETDIELVRQGTAADPKVAAMVACGQQVLAAEVTDEQVGGLRELGYSDEQIAEVVGLVALNVLTGAVKLVAGLHPAMRSAA